MGQGYIWLIVCLIALGLVAVMMVLVRLPPYPRLETFAKIKAGMTRAEVWSTVGGPPGDYRSTNNSGPRKQLLGGHLREEWKADDGTLIVGFDVHGRVVGALVADASKF